MYTPIDEEKLCIGCQLELGRAGACQETPALLTLLLCRERNHVQAVTMKSMKPNHLMATVID